ncbi:hypothetical protein EDB80DRAFT_831121, partial [Ilyonectria destructans]
KHPPTSQDLKPFLRIRKDKKAWALHYLVQHNHLYHDITINHTMTDAWPSDFIPPEIADSIIHLKDPDHHEREGYTVSLQTGNYENDFQAAQDEAFLPNDNDPFVTGSVYTDVNGERTDSNLRLIDALLGVVTGNTRWVDETYQAADSSDEPEHEHRQRDLPTISYAIHSQATLMSSWEDLQRMARTESQVKTVSLNGQFSQYQIQEEGVRGGHPNTTAIKNDLAEVQLGFFLPWDQLPALFQQHASEYDTKRDACSRVWDIVEPTLSPHNRNFARN